MPRQPSRRRAEKAMTIALCSVLPAGCSRVKTYPRLNDLAALNHGGFKMRVSAIAFVLTVLASPFVNAGERDVIELVARDSARASSLALERAPLKSATDVYQYSQAMPKNLSPLSALSDSERDRFIQSLRFNEKGLTQFDYSILKGLPTAKVYKILALFGMQSGTELISATPKSNGDTAPQMIMADFLLDHYCESKGTCREDNSRACTSNC